MALGITHPDPYHPDPSTQENLGFYERLRLLCAYYGYQAAAPGRPLLFMGRSQWMCQRWERSVERFAGKIQSVSNWLMLMGDMGTYSDLGDLSHSIFEIEWDMNGEKKWDRTHQLFSGCVSCRFF